MEPSHPRGGNRGRLVVIGFVALLSGVVGVSLTTNLLNLSARIEGPAKPDGLVSRQKEQLDIVAASGRVSRFNVEVMRTDADRARGLMFRTSLPQDDGMLFDFERDQMVSMWMKNTLIPLDMVFVLADGRIHRIESNTEPQSEKIVSSGVPVRAVLELNAGVAARLGLKPGDRLVHPLFR